MMQLLWLLLLLPLSSDALTSARYALTVPEEAEPPHSLGNAAEYLGDSFAGINSGGGGGDSGSSGLRYAMESRDPFVDVHPTSGSIRLVARIDLESMCRQQQRSASTRCPRGAGVGQHRFVVAVRREVSAADGAVATSPIVRLSFLLNVTDVNDHSPRFPADAVDIRRDESVCIVIPQACQNRRIDLPVAEDADYSTEFSRVAYAVAPESMSPETADTFELKMDHFGAPFLYLLRGLDAERRQFYQFDLLARDSRGREGRTHVRLTVQDVNDNSPVFRSRHSAVSVSEDQPAGSIVVKLVAEDADLHHKLSYSIDSGSTEESRRHFSVLQDGSVVIRQPLDYEARAEHEFLVRVDDGRFDDKATVHVRVLDANDNRPEYTETGPLQVEEGALPGQVVGSVRASDRDTGSGGQVHCSPIDDTESSGLRLVPSDVGVANVFNIVTVRSFDRELQPVALGRLACADRGRPSLSSTHTATVRVLDRNDNSPTFPDADRWGRIEVTVPEGGRPGTKVAQLRALDRDEGNNAVLAYRLIGDGGGDSRFFAIDSASGILRAVATLDRETRATYQIRVEASDSGQSSRTAGVLVRVTVLDVNDNAPEFVGPRELALPENTEPPVVLGRLNATDADEGANSQVTFSLVSSSDRPPLFRVDPDGTVTVLRRLDREQCSRHQLTIELADRGRQSLRVDAQLTIRVLDENDSPPRIVQPAANSSAPAARISIYTHPPGASVLLVRATDPDEGKNARIEFSLAAPDAFPPRFGVDSATGQVRVARELGLADVRRHRMLVRASNPGTDLADTAILHIDVDNAAPSASQSDEAELAAAHTRRNVLIIAVLAGVSAILAVTLIVAITCVNQPCGDVGGQLGRLLAAARRRGQRRRRRQRQHGNSGKFSQASLSDAGGGGGTSAPDGQFDELSGLQLTDPAWTTGLPDPLLYRTLECHRQLLTSPGSCPHRCQQRRCQHLDVSLGGSRQPLPRPASAAPGQQHLLLQQPHQHHLAASGYWLQQISEDAVSPPSGSTLATSTSATETSRCSISTAAATVAAVDGAQSDSGRGCSDEDLSWPPVPSGTAACHQTLQPAATLKATFGRRLHHQQPSQSASSSSGAGIDGRQSAKFSLGRSNSAEQACRQIDCLFFGDVDT